MRALGAEHVRGTAAHLLGCPGVVGKGGHDPGIGAATHQETEPFGEHSGLSRTCRCDHPSRARGMVDRGQLVRGQVGIRVQRRRCEESARLRTPPVDHLRSVLDHWRVGRAAIHPPWRAVRLGDVRWAALGDSLVGEQACQLASMPPDQFAVPGVIGVGPHQEVQPLPPEGERRSQFVHGAFRPLGLAQGVRIDAELDDHWPASEPRSVQCLDDFDDFDRAVEHARSHLDPGGVRPPIRRQVACAYHHAPGELIRSGNCHRPNLPSGCVTPAGKGITRSDVLDLPDHDVRPGC